VHDDGPADHDDTDAAGGEGDAGDRDDVLAFAY
jgi:hypothetical protein